MLATLAWTALVMGLVGGPHCLAMCAAPCGALTAGATPPSQTLPGTTQSIQWMPRAKSAVVSRTVAFHVGRLVGYAAFGGLAAFAMEQLAWMTQQTAALRPVWTLLHAAVLAWGLLLLVQARQPAWVDDAGRAIWRKVKPAVNAPGGMWVAGAAWTMMPCGLLYSALLVAALSGGAFEGALTMGLFGAGSAVWLVAGPWAWKRLRTRINVLRDSWGTRLAGLLLFCMGAWALWMDVVHQQQAFWCR
ncbi:MAG: sulfite exporter TauE/SafE family protein [Comamonadaceae bacterium]|nr:MAG: sulfite exporter TauE/SafE family protein [Comamonadaceae bacterium]